MTRDAHSASSIELGTRCARAWAYRYLDGLKPPEVPWAEIAAGAPCTSRQRSLAFGKALHAAIEAYYRGREPDWSSEPGRAAALGLGYLPDPTRCGVVEVERPIGWSRGVPCPPTATPTDASIEIAGVRWRGARDLLLAPDAGERAHVRLPVAPPGAAPLVPVVLVDHKSSTDVTRWARTPADLATDLQASVYALDVIRVHGGHAVQCRWLYYPRRGPRVALPVDFVVARESAAAVVAAAADTARRLDAIESSDTATPNPSACHDYGGCEYHASAGGPCTVLRSIDAACSRTNKRSRPPMTPAERAALRAEFAAQQADAAPAAPAPEAAPAKPRVGRFAKPVPIAAPAAAPPTTTAELIAPPPAAPKRRGRPPAAPAPVAPPPPPPAPGAITADLAAITAAQAELAAAAAELAEAEERARAAEAKAVEESVALAEAQASVAAILERIRAACG